MSTRPSFGSTTGLISGLSSPSRQAFSGGTKSGGKKKLKELTLVKASRAGVVPLAPEFIVGIAITLSVLFILSLLCVFLGADYEESAFQKRLDKVATENPGIVIIGDNVDVDVDEPSVGFRWSILGCGDDFVLPGSEGIHDSSLCGLPAMPLSIYVDSQVFPAVVYDPAQFPTVNGTARRLNIDNLYQFDSDHVLDVHEQRLYPFDTYRLTTTLRAQCSKTNKSLPIRGLWTVTEVSSFDIANTDTASRIANSHGTQVPSRDISVTMRRPGHARAITMLLFILAWMLAHATIGCAVIAWSSDDKRRLLRHFEYVFVTILIIPALRDTMPDAPGLDGEFTSLCHTVGFFPQMLLAGMSAISVLLMLATRELQGAEEQPTVLTQVRDDRPRASEQFREGMRRLRRAVTSVDFNKHLSNLGRSVKLGDRTRRHGRQGSLGWDYSRVESYVDRNSRAGSDIQGTDTDRLSCVPDFHRPSSKFALMRVPSLASSRGYSKSKSRLATIRQPKQTGISYSEWVV
ncbi:hypothetical protein OBBRIDRAFT_753513 [Obba rivulosa]|uniref:Transmembrane protein n=1 Tax=Obba rivulosa TaxID=1052685 RepID=A0A8E2AUE7_9APHY|nr:hypothetical protein OBBRIDRAFT_753513 [Obba rivulosa]